MRALSRQDIVILAVAALASVLSGMLNIVDTGPVATFVAAAVALSGLATMVGQATEQLGERLGPGATGILQSAIGNLPELFVGIFLLRAGLVSVIQAALVGSILGNSLLVLGLAFLIGGVRHGTQRFASEPPRMIAVLTLLAVAALAVPTLAHELHGSASAHTEALSVASAVMLLIIFAASIPFSLSGGAGGVSYVGDSTPEQAWPVWLAAAILCAAGVGAAFVSDIFVTALGPAISALHLSRAFTGLVVVAVAGNVVENVVGVRLAAHNRADYAISVILNSSLQVALGLIPALVLLSFVIGGAHLTLVMPPLLVAALGLSAALGALIVYDGESTWLEGAALIGLYVIIAAAFWWG